MRGDWDEFISSQGMCEKSLRLFEKKLLQCKGLLKIIS